jgi:predicted nucleic acid-binding protein
MIIIDTSIWIEYFKQNSQYSNQIMKLLETQKVLAVECIFGELLQGVKNNREREIINSYWENLPKCNDNNVWIDAGNYSSEHKLISKGIGLIDTVILISAQKNNAKIWTLDKKLMRILKKEEKYIL